MSIGSWQWLRPRIRANTPSLYWMGGFLTSQFGVRIATPKMRSIVIESVGQNCDIVLLQLPLIFSWVKKKPRDSKRGGWDGPIGIVLPLQSDNITHQDYIQKCSKYCTCHHKMARSRIRSYYHTNGVRSAPTNTSLSRGRVDPSQGRGAGDPGTRDSMCLTIFSTRALLRQAHMHLWATSNDKVKSGSPRK